MKSLDCCEHHVAHNKADTALPHNWLQDVIFILDEDYEDIRQHVFWDYSEPHRCFGAPRAQCLQAKKVLDAYYKALKQQTPVFDTDERLPSEVY